jgi:hypothetical protein
MNRLILSTGADLNYLNNITPYLHSIEENSNFDKNILIFVGDNSKIINNFKKIEINTLPISSIQSLNVNKCVQHGDFLNSSEFDNNTIDSDIIFFTDGDIILQRSLSEDELTFYRNFTDGDVYVGYNASPTDTLYAESIRIGRTGFYSQQIILNNWNEVKVYNTGVLAMNKKTWKNLLKKYVDLFPHINQMFTHYAKQQWLISYIIGNDKEFNIIEMPYDIHNHRHYPSPIGTHVDNNKTVYYNNKKVLFKHKW